RRTPTGGGGRRRRTGSGRAVRCKAGSAFRAACAGVRAGACRWGRAFVPLSTSAVAASSARPTEPKGGKALGRVRAGGAAEGCRKPWRVLVRRSLHRDVSEAVLALTLGVGLAAQFGGDRLGGCRCLVGARIPELPAALDASDESVGHRGGVEVPHLAWVTPPGAVDALGVCVQRFRCEDRVAELEQLIELGADKFFVGLAPGVVGSAVAVSLCESHRAEFD